MRRSNTNYENLSEGGYFMDLIGLNIDFLFVLSGYPRWNDQLNGEKKINKNKILFILKILLIILSVFFLIVGN